MEMSNITFPKICDPCLVQPFHLYPVLLVVPAIFCFPMQSLVLCNQASSKLTEKTDIFTLGIIFVDFLLSFFTIISAITLKFVPFLYIYAWSCLLGLLSLGHPLCHCLVCLERYLAVKHPVVFLKYRPLRYRIVVLAIAGGYTMVGNAFVMSICTLYLHLLHIFLKLQCLFLSGYVAANSFACLSILRTLIKPSPGEKEIKSRNGTNKNDGKFGKRKAFDLILCVQISMLVCYLPPIIFFLASNPVQNLTQFCSIYLYNVWFIGLTSAIHCLMYLHNKKQLKKTSDVFLRVFKI